MDEFIRALLEQVRCKKARAGIAREITDYIEDAAHALEQEGMTHEQALASAVQSMGDPVSIGVELDRIHRPRMDWRTFIMIVILNLGGLMVQYAATGISGMQCLYTMIGLAVMIGICYLDYSFLARYARACYWIMTAAFLFVYWGAQSGVLDGMSLWVNGSSLRGFAILTMLYIPVYAGILYTCRGSRMKGLLRAIAYMIPPLFFSLHSSISSSMCIWIVFYGMILYALWKGWFRLERKIAVPVCAFAAFILPILSAVFFYFFGAADYQKVRIIAFLNPQSDSQGSGYFYNILRTVLSECRWLGSSGGEGPVQSFFAFGREWMILQLVISYGWICGLAVIAALATFIIKVFGITAKAGNQLGRMIGFGCGMLLLTESVLGIGMNLGVFPSTTVCMPFLAYGFCNSVVYAVLCGFILSICRYRNVLTEHNMLRSPEKIAIYKN